MRICTVISVLVVTWLMLAEGGLGKQQKQGHANSISEKKQGNEGSKIQSFDENGKVEKNGESPRKRGKKDSGESYVAASQGKEDKSHTNKKKNKSSKGKKEKNGVVVEQEGMKAQKKSKSEKQASKVKYSEADGKMQRSEEKKKRDKRSKRLVDEEINNRDEMLQVLEEAETENVDGEEESLLPEADSKSEKSSRKEKSTKKTGKSAEGCEAKKEKQSPYQKSSENAIDGESIDEDIAASLPEKNRKDDKKSGKKSKNSQQSKKNKRNGCARLEDEHGLEACEKNSCAELKSTAAVTKNEVNNIESEKESVAHELEE